MKYLTKYSSSSLANLDITRPRVYLTGSDTTPYYDAGPLVLTEIYSGSGTVSAKSTGSYTYSGLGTLNTTYTHSSGWTNFYSTSSGYFIDLDVNSLRSYSSKIIGIKINDGDLIPGYYTNSSGSGWSSWSFQSQDLLIIYEHRDGSGQGQSGKTAKGFYSMNSVNLTENSNITFKLYTW